MPTVAELKAIAEENDVELPADARKADIEEALSDAGIDFDGNGEDGDEEPDEDAPEFPGGVDDGVAAEVPATQANNEREAAAAAAQAEEAAEEVAAIAAAANDESEE